VVKNLDKTLENSKLMHTLCEGNVQYLTENKRSDHKLFDFCKSICPGGSRHHLSIRDMVKEAAAEFPVKPGLPDYTFVISHAKRMMINRRHNMAKKRGDILLATPKSKKSVNQAQNFFLYPGMMLVGCMEQKQGNLANGLFYKVVDASTDSVTLDNNGTQFEIPTATAARCLRMTYALTYASIESLTLHGRVRLSDTGHSRMDWRKLNVALSRATSSELVEVET
jgi:hypothetical protein